MEIVSHSAGSLDEEVHCGQESSVPTGYLSRETGHLCTSEEVETGQKEETGLRLCWLGCVSRCLERLQYLYNRKAKLQTPSSRRAKSTYNAVCASVMPSISPRKGTSVFTGLAVGPASRRGQWGAQALALLATTLEGSR